MNKIYSHPPAVRYYLHTQSTMGEKQGKCFLHLVEGITTEDPAFRWRSLVVEGLTLYQLPIEIKPHFLGVLRDLLSFPFNHTVLHYVAMSLPVQLAFCNVRIV